MLLFLDIKAALLFVNKLAFRSSGLLFTVTQVMFRSSVFEILFDQRFYS